MLRLVLGVVAGAVVGVLVVALIEGAGHAMFPPPANMNLQDLRDLMSVMSRAQPGALAMVVVGWALGALAGGWVAAVVGRSLAPAILVGGLQLGFGVATMLSIPHPVWMWICGVALPIPMAWIGGRLATSRGPIPAARGTAAG